MAAINVQAMWDDEAHVWVATSDDVPGLATEAETVEALVTKLQTLIPELLQANGRETGEQIPFTLHSERLAVTAA